MIPSVVVAGAVLALLGVACERAGADTSDPWGRGVGVVVFGLGGLFVLGGVIA